MLPTWDLFIIVFFILITAYSFMIGRAQTVKIIIASYLAILSADGLGNIIATNFFGSNSPIPLFPNATDVEALVVLKIALFLLAIVFVVMNAGFTANVATHVSSVVNFIALLFLGMLSATLILSAILVYISGSSFVFAAPEMSETFRSIVYDQSPLAKFFVDQASITFSLPAIAIVFASLPGRANTV